MITASALVPSSPGSSIITTTTQHTARHLKRVSQPRERNARVCDQSRNAQARDIPPPPLVSALHNMPYTSRTCAHFLRLGRIYVACVCVGRVGSLIPPPCASSSLRGRHRMPIKNALRINNTHTHKQYTQTQMCKNAAERTKTTRMNPAPRIMIETQTRAAREPASSRDMQIGSARAPEMRQPLSAYEEHNTSTKLEGRTLNNSRIRCYQFLKTDD